MKKPLLLLFLLCFTLAASAQQSYNVSFNHDGKTLYGNFTKPSGTGKFPTIIINPGSGANDRNGTVQMAGGNVQCLYPSLLNTTLYPYKELSDALVAAGYAVLRYDKIEYTYTTAAALGPITFHKLWLPVESAIDYVKTRNDVDANRLILIGHSEGSSLIPYIAKRRTDIKALISIAGPRTPLDSLLAYQIQYITQTCNGNVLQANSDANTILNYFSAIRNNTWNASTPLLFGVPANVWVDYTRVTDSVALNYNAANLPTLFTGLQLDINVPPKEITRFQKGTTIGADFYRIPDLIHYMTPINVPHVSKVLTDTIIYWLGQRMVTGLKQTTQEDAALQISPNPLTNDCMISINKSNLQKVEITIKNLLGEEILKAHYENLDAGFRKNFDMNGIPPGIYLVNINADGRLLTRKIIRQ